MLYSLLRFAHLVGMMLIAAGLIGVFIADLRTRQARTLPIFAEAVRSIGLFYDGLVVPGAVTLLASGTWLIVAFYGWGFVAEPWLAGMVVVFAFEFIEGNTVTRIYFLRLRRLTRDAMLAGQFTPALDEARGATVPSFTHFLDLPILMLIVSLGVFRPDNWTVFIIGAAAALAVATALTMMLSSRRFHDTVGVVPPPSAGD